ncbi:Triosephosphate isomerase [Trichinella spiralis]|uniref:Triosephosphate isomerase n=1 Tax=Trichinella spiralis TaxID=6334 RepID=A0ABR3KRY1_TRISP
MAIFFHLSVVLPLGVCEAVKKYPDSTQSSSIDPCLYPSPTAPHFMERCQVTTAVTQQFLICDPDSIMSISEIEEVVKQLKRLDLHYGNHCLCDSGQSQHCWYQIGFAFVEQFHFILSLLENTYEPASYCNTSDRNALSSGIGVNKWSRQMIQLYGGRFAEIIRRQWNFGRCGEDILILIVKNRPQMSPHVSASNPTSMIFLSKGIAVSERTNHMITHGIRSLDFVIDKYNERLEEGFSLKLIFEQLLKDLSTVLLLADQTFYMPRNRSHIPTWAIAAFGACAGLLIIMALGLILVRRRERGAFKRGQSKDKSDRRWKAGFVGDVKDVKVHLLIKKGHRSNKPDRFAQVKILKADNEASADNNLSKGITLNDAAQSSVLLSVGPPTCRQACTYSSAPTNAM